MIDQDYPSSSEAGEAGYRRLISLNELKDPSLPTVAEQVIDRIKSGDPGSEQIDLARFILAEHYFQPAGISPGGGCLQERAGP